MKKHVRLTFPIITLFAIAVTAYAGGWAIITVNELSDFAEAGKPVDLTFSVRQHGVTPLADLKPTVRATTRSGLKVNADAKPTGKKGEYRAALVLPQPAEWSITIESGFLTSKTTLPLLKVVPSGAPPPTRFTDGTRGSRLFVSKGCVGCHRHVEINPGQSFTPKMDLSTRRFENEYLKKFLADPSITTEDMPNLHLKQQEITELAAFLNKLENKKKLIDSQK